LEQKTVFMHCYINCRYTDNIAAPGTIILPFIGL
jgi:hypothetical protein